MFKKNNDRIVLGVAFLILVVLVIGGALFRKMEQNQNLAQEPATGVDVQRYTANVRTTRNDAEVVLRQLQANFNQLNADNLRVAMQNADSVVEVVNNLNAQVNDVLSGNYENRGERLTVEVIRNTNIQNQLAELQSAFDSLDFDEIDYLLAKLDEKREDVAQAFKDWRGNFSLVFGGKLLQIVNAVSTGGDFVKIYQSLPTKMQDANDDQRNLLSKIENLLNSVEVIITTYNQQNINVQSELTYLIEQFPNLYLVRDTIVNLGNALSPDSYYRKALEAVASNIQDLNNLVPPALK